MRKKIILFFLLSKLLIFSQTNAPKRTMLNDTVWAKSNFFSAETEFISIEKYPLLPCGYISDHTIARFKIIKTDNTIVEAKNIYNFYINCNVLKSEPKKGQLYNIDGILKFNPKDTLLKNANSFKGDDPNRIYLLNIKPN